MSKQRIKETIVFTSQDEAVKAWEELVANWYMFMWDWEYDLWPMTYKIGYDDWIHAIGRKVEIYEEIWIKKAKKKGLIK